MATDVIIPHDLWEEDDKTGSIVVWLYRDGSTVRQGDVIAEVLVEKVTLELVAPASGVLRIRVEPEVVVSKGDLVAVIE
ncbi:MAG: lipoyl domain-containing protein [Sphingomonadaceae bacterium]|uniref:lipoyl domain-containing protein n=1 Tax=Thermaurantiacus sp. TaxID=2820283 RepID=UPI00298F33FA|nr:lipoyl domain-containing protein [Thermaurantiacus sp.]MCS6986962.1 lipoyl domain-containing protein [Sphingomonadaceae bacterium]MDW8415438.1 lipoyl domain-containing protein [Thermaurantiacus sp.]